MSILPARAELSISEFVANNKTSLNDSDGDSSDWIEIHNQGETLNLGGYGLTDDPALPLKWTFPNGQFLGTDSYLVVFASGKDRLELGEQLHTNFSLESGGDYLALAGPDGVVIQEFSPTFPGQRRDVGYGIGSDSGTGFLHPATPGSANGPTLAGFVSDTVFSHKRGFYRSPITVEINSTTPGVSIRYTTDGSEPGPGIGRIYTGPIPVSTTTVLRALATKTGLVPTNVDAQSYLFPADIITQPEMIPSIVNSPTYRSEIQPALEALPVVSLSFNHDDILGPIGIHSRPTLSGPTSERDVHFEYFNPADPTDSTHEPGGVRIHGGNSREHPKKNFRLYFRADYGNSRLKHDLFPGSTVASFKHLLLRGGGHDAWTFQEHWDQASLIRNEYLHRLQLSMGQPSPHGRMVSLFLNGDYWGVYELQELPHENFNADHHGGDPDDWDVIKHGAEVEAGNSAAWDELISLARAGIGTEADYAAIQQYLDIDHFADAMIHRIWCSDQDWLAPELRNGTDISRFSEDKNWYVARKSRNGTSKFFFYSWDAEMSMGIPFNSPPSFLSDFTRVDNDNSPGIIYDALRQHPEFQLRFADRLQKHMFTEGALTVAKLHALWDPLAEEVRTPMVGESARWGRENYGGEPRLFPYSRNTEWIPATNWIRSQFLANRTTIVLDQFRRAELFPDVSAPVPSPAGTTSPHPLNLTFTTPSPESTIYFTTDGSDPRVPGNGQAISLVGSSHPVHAIVPNSFIHSQIGATWIEIPDPTNLALWISGENGVGFEKSPQSTPNYVALIKTPLPNMHNSNPSAYIRLKFDISDQSVIDSLNSLTLRMRYDDGFAAYLNGTLIESQNVNATNWNSAASGSHSDIEAVNFVSFDQTSDLGLLRPGENLLAIHGFNGSAVSNDFLIQAVLEGGTGSPGGTLARNAQEFTEPIPILHTTRVRARTRSSDGTWSALSDLLYRIGTPASFANFKLTEIHYHPTNPATAAELALSTSDNDFEFLELQNVGPTTIDLSGCRFDEGIEFEFPFGTTLPAGEHLLLVSNRDAFLARYGATVDQAIFGQFANDTKLSNRGERLTLLDITGDPLFSFPFDDVAPWPTTPDGGGPSLVLIDPLQTPETELDDGAQWRASHLDFGGPGLSDDLSFDLWTRMIYGPLDGTDPSIAGPLVVPGPGGLSNLMLYAQGQDLSSGEPSALNIIEFISHENEEFLTLTFQLRDDLGGLSNVTPEVSGDLLNWSPDVAVVSQTQNGDGTSSITVRDLVPLTSAEQRYIRLRIDR